LLGFCFRILPPSPSDKRKEETTKLQNKNNTKPLSAVSSFHSCYCSIEVLTSRSEIQEKEEKLDGDAAVNKLFRDIYQSSDEDMRRAMSKSFVRFLHCCLLLMPYTIQDKYILL
jgi:hypothetical protein